MTQAMIDLLAICCQNGNLEMMETVARSMLAAVPDDIVAWQFLGLTLYMKGRPDDAMRVFRTFAKVAARRSSRLATSCELAATASYHLATQAGSGLTKGWAGIAKILTQIGFKRHAANARKAALSAGGRPDPQVIGD